MINHADSIVYDYIMNDVTPEDWQRRKGAAKTLYLFWRDNYAGENVMSEIKRVGEDNIVKSLEGFLKED